VDAEFEAKQGVTTIFAVGGMSQWWALTVRLSGSHTRSPDTHAALYFGILYLRCLSAKHSPLNGLSRDIWDFT
jgi:hypothetical protein